MREYMDVPVNIDGRAIPYPVETAADYFAQHDCVEDVDKYKDENPDIYTLVTQILALKQSCFLLRHTTHTCQSLSDSLFELKERLIKELKRKHGYEFDDLWMENLVDNLGDRWQEVSSPDSNYRVYRKIASVNGIRKGIWKAVHKQSGQEINISYDQARGYEPIVDDSIKKLSRMLGKKLLPRK